MPGRTASVHRPRRTRELRQRLNIFRGLAQRQPDFVSNEPHAAGLDFPATGRRATTVFEYPLSPKGGHKTQPQACDH